MDEHTEDRDVLSQVDALLPTSDARHSTQVYENGSEPPEPAQPPDEQQEQLYWTTQAFTLAQFLKRPPKQWLVDRVFGVQDFLLVYGESGHGKTHALLDLAFSCATGRAFAGQFTVARPLSVVYATAEGTGGLADRLRAVQAHYAAQDLPLSILTDVPQLFQAAQPNGALHLLQQWPALTQAGLVPAQLDLLLIDTLHLATVGSDENSAGDAGVTLASMRRLRDTLGCAIGIAHHAAKGSGLERGSTALRAQMDAVLKTTKTGNSYTLACEKLKDGEAWKAQTFTLEPTEESVHVEWQGEAAQLTESRNAEEQRVLAHLQAHAGRRFTSAELALELHDTDRKATQVHNVCTKLAKAGTVWSEKEERHAGAVKRSVAVWFVPAR